MSSIKTILHPLPAFLGSFASSLALGCSIAPASVDGTGTAEVTVGHEEDGLGCWIQTAHETCDATCEGKGGNTQACCFTTDSYTPGLECGGACVDTRYDMSNCGGCGITCESHDCIDSVCVPVDCGTAPTSALYLQCSKLCQKIDEAGCGDYEITWAGSLNLLAGTWAGVDACVTACVPEYWGHCTGEMASLAKCWGDSLSCPSGGAATFGQCAAEEKALTACLVPCGVVPQAP
jgi:hypothetical protein